MSTQDIYNFMRVNDQLITGGQPTEEQIQSAATEGFTAVINLATISPRYSLPDEAGLVRSLGMAYHHIPVVWSDPKESDFDEFEKLFQQLGAEKILLHCAANYRVSAFYSLYALKHLGWSEAQADAFRAPIWTGSDFPVWDDLIRRIKAKILSAHHANEK